MNSDDIAAGEALFEAGAQRINATTRLHDAITALGGPVRFMDVLEIPDKYVFGQLASGERKIPYRMAVRVAELTHGAIHQSELRPDIWEQMQNAQTGVEQGIEPIIDLQTKAFEALQVAFKAACENPGMRNFRAAAAACDEFERVCSL